MKKVLLFSLVYPVFSILVETILRLLGYEVPKDANFLAVVLLTIVPAGSAWIAQYKGHKELITVLSLTIIFTLLLSYLLDDVGIVRPFILRVIAGILAASLTYTFTKPYTKTT